MMMALLLHSLIKAMYTLGVNQVKINWVMLRLKVSDHLELLMLYQERTLNRYKLNILYMLEKLLNNE